MPYRNACVIVNPSSGKPEPILSVLNDYFQDADIKWEVQVTIQSGDAKKYALNAVDDDKDVVITYGGDGTVMEVAQALMNTEIPLLILPGGSANIMAKELHLPATVQECLSLLSTGSQEKLIDMGQMNDTPFLLRISIGATASLVLNTTPEQKSNLGQLAYTIPTLQELSKATETEYEITIDGNTVTVHGSTLLVVNTANMGMTDLSLLPDITVDDGVLDILLLKSLELAELASTLTAALIHQKLTDNIRHWKMNKAHIKVPGDQQLICDDSESYEKEFDISVIPKALKVIVPNVT